MERSPSVERLPSKLFDRRRSFRDIQGVISKMNPELLKSVIGSVELKSNDGKFSENGDALALALNPLTLKHHESVFPPAFGGNTCGLGSLTTETTPLTIFYNGTVAVYEVPRPRAENILKLAVSSRNGNLPIARRKSLQRFLEKRKERLNLASRNGCPADGTKLSVQKSTRYCRL
ncbi:protein TIFY 9-like isoform X1 [Rhododendron vialii]|uniref:protein TIFY 9-like isoform X1 n=1 Tax=Rhododendron vialii TaxID=182163 RepID=UPI00265F11BF|nr:protein TIFY 9-like isoform X1 [Rhododendron vialii]